MKRHILLSLLFCLCYLSLFGQIAVDGLFEDWKNITSFQEDSGDNATLDIEKVWLSNDNNNLYIRIDCDQEFDLQDDQAISIYIDADNNPSTGFPANGVGSEITFYFANRQGFINFTGQSYSTNHSSLGLISLPTVTSNSFEIAISRTAVSSLGSIEMGETIRVSVENGLNGDKVPNMTGGIVYQMQNLPTFLSTYDLEKQDPNLTRVMTYNVENDGFLFAERREELQKIIKALQPDIIAFQEVYSTPLEDIQEFLNTELPSASGRSWQYAKANPDVAVFTRGYMEAFNRIDGNGVFLLYDETGQLPLIIYNAHFPCCANDVGRQNEIDNLMSVMRDKESSGAIGFLYENEAPTLILGDFNLVGENQNYKTLIEGDIFDENTFGPDFGPDWDGSNLEDANPYVTGFPSNYTWRNDNGSYNPGKLDFILYTGSVMQQRNAFVFDSEFLTMDELNSLGLSASATTLASDHLPVVVDFNMRIVDMDMDGFTSDQDCDDTNADVNPDAMEIPYNGLDDDCDPLTLDDDLDEDGFPMSEDCDDMNADVNPDAMEIPYNGLDDDCDASTLDDDLDEDGFPMSEDCDDMNADVNPDAMEIPYNGLDDDCDPLTLDDDLDEDGFPMSEDCDDMNADVNSDAMEIPYNGLDDDCDASTLDDDLDEDGFPMSEDCDDMNTDVNPDASEIPYNGVDDDCDASTLDDDLDGDGFPMSEDCDDMNADVNPDAMEIPDNGIDEDCDGRDLLTSLKETELYAWRLYPNPASNTLRIQAPKDGLFTFQIVNNIGVLMNAAAVGEGIEDIDVSALDSGQYFMIIKFQKKQYRLPFIKL